MHLSVTMLRDLALATVGLGICSSALALSCEELRAAVEAKVQSNGVSRFSVVIVEAGSTAAGKVVGTCERGTKKLIYTQGIASEPLNAFAARPVRPPSAPSASVITECADGRVITQGSCKK